MSPATLGSLNAAHASATARSNAAPGSAVAAVADFAKAVEANDIEAAAEALASKANKSIDTAVVTEVSALAGVAIDETTANAIADHAASLQAGEVTSSED